MLKKIVSLSVFVMAMLIFLLPNSADAGIKQGWIYYDSTCSSIMGVRAGPSCSWGIVTAYGVYGNVSCLPL